MLRYLQTLLGFLAAVSAILAPICVLHWLLLLTTLPLPLNWLHQLDPIFNPPSQWIGQSLVFLPKFSYHGQAVDVGQGILSISFTLLFLLLSFGSKLLQVTETRIKVGKERHNRLANVAAIHIANQEKVRQRLSVNQLLILIEHDFTKNARTAQLLRGVQAPSCSIISESDEHLLLVFKNIQEGLAFILTAKQKVQQLYLSLRPIDPKPPYKIVLHALGPETPIQQGKQQCEALIRFCNPQQLLCTDSIIHYMREKKLEGEVNSLGFYDLPDEQRQELFQLQ